MSAVTTMTPRERYIETVTYGTPDRIPMMTMGPREPTIARWQEEGLKGTDWFGQLAREAGIEYDSGRVKPVNLGVDFRLMPQFEEKVLEHAGGHYLVQDWMGNVVEIADTFDLRHLRHAVDFVTRKWHRFPVSNAEGFEAMKARYDVNTPGRFPDDFKERCRRAEERDRALSITIPGPFWQLREWCGFEPLCEMFIEEPELIRAMCEFWSDFVAQMLERICDHITVDRIAISEDMAYKGAPMISPAMTREFLMPVWSRWGRIVRGAGVPVYDVDSDGKIDQLIPLWIESGFNLCHPVEVAAGCDLNLYSTTHGRKMAYTGGIDKRCIARGGQVLIDEFDRIRPVVKRGGYIPGCDHGMPFDIPWENMKLFMRLWAEVTGWL